MEYAFNILTECFEHLRFLGVLLAFVVAGVGVPIPEDVILLAAGYLAHLEPDPAKRLFALKIAITVCMVGIFIGDTLIYWMGRVWGTRLLRVPILRRTLTVKNIKRVEAYFARYGDKTVFFARFFAGFRMVAFFTAGAMRMRYWKFIAVDMLAALTSPIWVVLAWHFGDRIDDAFAAAKSAKHYVFLAVFVLLGAYVLYAILRRRRGAGNDGPPV